MALPNAGAHPMVRTDRSWEWMSPAPTPDCRAVRALVTVSESPCDACNAIEQPTAAPSKIWCGCSEIGSKYCPPSPKASKQMSHSVCRFSRIGQADRDLAAGQLVWRRRISAGGSWIYSGRIDPGREQLSVRGRFSWLDSTVLAELALPGRFSSQAGLRVVPHAAPPVCTPALLNTAHVWRAWGASDMIQWQYAGFIAKILAAEPTYSSFTRHQRDTPAAMARRPEMANRQACAASLPLSKKCSWKKRWCSSCE